MKSGLFCLLHCSYVHVYRLLGVCVCVCVCVCNFTAYIDNMAKLLISYQNDAKALAARGNNKDKLQTLLTKKKLVEKEVNS